MELASTDTCCKITCGARYSAGSIGLLIFTTYGKTYFFTTLSICSERGCYIQGCDDEKRRKDMCKEDEQCVIVQNDLN